MSISNIYKIDWSKFITMNMPELLLKTKQLSWLRGLISPLVSSHNAFLAFIEDYDFRIVTNGQVCRLRGALNTKFDPTLRRITIAKGSADKLYVFTHAENNPQYLTKYLGVGGGNFIVNVPVILLGNDAAIRLLIDTYKRPTKTYTINYV